MALDLGAAIEAFEGDLSAGTWVLHPRFVADIVLRTGGVGISSDLGLRGGTLLGLSAIVSAAVPFDSNGRAIVLLDPSGITAVDEGIEVTSSEQGTIELSDSPAGATDTPVSMANQIVSLYQAEAVALKAVRHTNWANGRAGGVVVVTGCDYAASL